METLPWRLMINLLFFFLLGRDLAEALVNFIAYFFFFFDNDHMVKLIATSWKDERPQKTAPTAWNWMPYLIASVFYLAWLPPVPWLKAREDLYITMKRILFKVCLNDGVGNATVRKYIRGHQFFFPSRDLLFVEGILDFNLTLKSNVSLGF